MNNKINLDLTSEDLSVVLQILQKHIPQYEVWAFGSRVKHTARKFSDLDLAIITHQPLSLQLLGEIQEAFSESELPIKVDLVDWSRIDEAFKKIISSQYIKIK